MAAGNTYTPIATTTLASATSSYVFTSIPTTYTDLILVATLVPGATNFDFQVGDGSIDTNTNYSSSRLYGNGTSAGSDRQLNNATGVLGNVTNPTTVPIHVITQFNNYSNTTTHKPAISRYNVSDNYTFSIAGLWRSTSAINRIQIYSTSAQNIPAGCTFTLYGIQAA